MRKKKNKNYKLINKEKKITWINFNNDRFIIK